MNEKRDSRYFVRRKIEAAKPPLREILPGDLRIEKLQELLTTWIENQKVDETSANSSEGVLQEPANEVARRIVNLLIKVRARDLKKTIQSLTPEEIAMVPTMVIPQIGKKLRTALNAVLAEYKTNATASPTATVVTPRSNRK